LDERIGLLIDSGLVDLDSWPELWNLDGHLSEESFAFRLCNAWLF